MRLLNSALLVALAASPLPAATFSYRVLGDDPGSWPAVLASLGLVSDASTGADIVVAPQSTHAAFEEWMPRVEHGSILLLEGESGLAAAFGFKPSAAKTHYTARSVEDIHAPALRIVWEKPLDLASFEIPKEARVFARERWAHAPLMAGYRRGAGAVLWIAAAPGPHGYDRFPYIAQALADLGFEPPFRSRRLWAFFDSSYRARIDPDYFAARWRAAGISALHIAAWHYWESDPASDEYLRRLIDACHRQAIAVYAWIELPHVSERFWADHPEWRERTALLQDAQLDWRKLMNLTNRDAFAAVSTGLRGLLQRFDWDGVNLAELYFESLEGFENPARFTPMNDDVRAGFRTTEGFDPAELFDARSAHSYEKDSKGLGKFLEFRAELARRQQTEWIGVIDGIRKTLSHLDLALTHVDDRFDTTMREKIGADTSRMLPMLSDHAFTFLIEDPATIWNLGPQRYPQIAARYRALTPAQGKLAIDINVVERYQDVYPTKQQTGIELFELVHTASLAFPRVALYFENSISRVDWPLLASSASTVARLERTDKKLVVDSLRGAGVPFKGPATVDGKPWPVADDFTVWLPAGVHTIEPGAAAQPIRVLDLNAELKSAGAIQGGIEFAYQSTARAMAMLDRVPARMELDGTDLRPVLLGHTLILPRGQHIVSLFIEPAKTPGSNSKTAR
jgi:hypothetical protein